MDIYSYLENIKQRKAIVMKRITALFLCILGVLLLSGCHFNAPLRNKMLEYYSQDDHYVELNGTIKSITYHQEMDELLIEVALTNGTSSFPYNMETGFAEFVIVDWSTQKYEFKTNDFITFQSAPKYFYNGHRLPIVYVEKGGKEYLPFYAGKENYIKWINKTFA